MNQSFGIINLSLVPLRAAPANRSEMRSQLLFGECFEILQTRDSWAYIRTAFDHYEGWMDQKQGVKIHNSRMSNYFDYACVYPLNLPCTAINRCIAAFGGL